MYDVWLHQLGIVSHLILLFQGVPLKAYPVVDGCPQESECSLTVKRNDTLRCTLKGIRPAVNLEWRVNEPDSGLRFVKERLVVQMTGDVYDVELSSQFTVSNLPRRMAIHCIAIGANIDLFNISETEVILLFAFGMFIFLLVVCQVTLLIYLINLCLQVVHWTTYCHGVLF